MLLVKDKSKLVHDINSSLGALLQACELIRDESIKGDNLLKIKDLLTKKIEEVTSDWQDLKEHL